jgi:hypothetical protein
LRIEIEKQDAPPDCRNASGEIDGGRSFADAAFLVGDSDDFGWHAGESLKSKVPSLKSKVTQSWHAVASIVLCKS